MFVTRVNMFKTLYFVMFGNVNANVYICIVKFEFFLMRDRIQTLLENEQMTNKQFADAVGINPAAVSHLLAGRNKPSFDLVSKILEAFPALNPDWLIMGRDPMYRSGNAASNGMPSVTPPARDTQEPDLFSLSGLSADGGWPASSGADSAPIASSPAGAPLPSDTSSSPMAFSAAAAPQPEPAAAATAPVAETAAAAPVATPGVEPQTIVKEVVKTLPPRKIVRVVVYFDDNTYEDFQTAKPVQN